MRNKIGISIIAMGVALLVVAPASALSVKLGGQPLVGNGTPASSSSPLVHVGVGGGNSVSAPALVDVNIGGTDGGNVPGGTGGGLLDLGGTGDLFDLGGAAGELDVAGVQVLPLNVDLDLGLDLFGNPIAPSSNGSNGANGSNGSSGGAQMASLFGDEQTCVDPSGAAVAALMNRHKYGSATFHTWAGVRAMQIVKLDVCASAREKIAVAVLADGNVVVLQRFLGSKVKVRAYLQGSGVSMGSIVAADRSGDKLIVYVM